MRLFEKLGPHSLTALVDAYQTAVAREKSDAAIIAAWKANYLSQHTQVDYRALAAALDRAQRVPIRW